MGVSMNFIIIIFFGVIRLICCDIIVIVCIFMLTLFLCTCNSRHLTFLLGIFLAIRISRMKEMTIEVVVMKH